MSRNLEQRVGSFVAGLELQEVVNTLHSEAFSFHNEDIRRLNLVLLQQLDQPLKVLEEVVVQ